MRNKSSDGRWWEFYLVRYLLPTLVGCFIIVWLLPYAGISVPEEGPAQGITLIIATASGSNFTLNFGNEIWMLLLACGFVFCYIASFPILVFHAVRNELVKHGGHIPVYILAVVVMTSILGLITNLPIPNYLISIIIVSIISILQIRYIVKYACKQPEYLRAISQTRIQRPDLTKSYRHLREHGNSALIILSEILLAYFCFSIFSVNQYRFTLNTQIQLAAMIAIWISPAASIYFVGQYFEYRFSNINKEEGNDNNPKGNI